MITEAQHQKLLIDWAKKTRRECKNIIAIPNGGSRHPAEAQNLKKQGVRAGVSDLFLPVPNHLYAGLWIEMKRDAKCRMSEAQNIWMHEMNMTGYLAVRANGFDEGKEIILDYIKK